MQPNDPKEILSLIPAGRYDPDCDGAKVFAAYMRGEITRDDYMIQNAQIAITQRDGYAPKQYLGFPTDIRSYAEARVGDARAYDPDLSRKLRTWIRTQFRIMDANEVSKKLLMWAIEKLADKCPAMAEQGMKTLEAHINNPFPDEDFRKADWAVMADNRVRVAEKTSARR